MGQRKPLSFRSVGFLKHKVLDKGQLNIGRIVYLAFRKSCVQAPAPQETRCGSEVLALRRQEGQMFKVIL